MMKWMNRSYLPVESISEGGEANNSAELARAHSRDLRRPGIGCTRTAYSNSESFAHTVKLVLLELFCSTTTEDHTET